MKTSKINLIGFSRSQLTEVLISRNIINQKELYRVKQLWHWLYFQGVSNFSQMTTLSLSFQKNCLNILLLIDLQFQIIKCQKMEQISGS